MPKIPSLPPLSSPAPADELPVEDNSASTTKRMTIQAMMEMIYPIGSIYTNAAVSTNPATLLGFGTWTAFASGRVLVGVDTGQTEFDTLGETGGAKTHTLTSGEMPSHTHTQNSHNHQEQVATAGGAGTGITGTANLVGNTGSNQSTVSTTATNQNTGGGGAHNNLQPYITVYMWQRTA